jgi:hypothetical protein
MLKFLASPRGKRNSPRSIQPLPNEILTDYTPNRNTTAVGVQPVAAPLGGIGCAIELQGTAVKICSVLPGGAAAAAEIAAGSEILAIDGFLLAGLPWKHVGLLLVGHIGTSVALTLRPPDGGPPSTTVLVRRVRSLLVSSPRTTVHRADLALELRGLRPAADNTGAAAPSPRGAARSPRQPREDPLLIASPRRPACRPALAQSPRTAALAGSAGLLPREGIQVEPCEPLAVASPAAWALHDWTNRSGRTRTAESFVPNSATAAADSPAAAAAAYAAACQAAAECNARVCGGEEGCGPAEGGPASQPTLPAMCSSHISALAAMLAAAAAAKGTLAEAVAKTEEGVEKTGTTAKTMTKAAAASLRTKSPPGAARCCGDSDGCTQAPGPADAAKSGAGPDASAAAVRAALSGGAVEIVAADRIALAGRTRADISRRIFGPPGSGRGGGGGGRLATLDVLYPGWGGATVTLLLVRGGPPVPAARPSRQIGPMGASK